MRDPANGDYRVEPGFGAEGYGCLSQTGPAQAPEEPQHGAPPQAGTLVSGSLAEVAGSIAQNTTWAAQVVRVTGEVQVRPGAALTIAPGVRVQFAGHHRLLVNGRLWAVGTATQRIVFEPAVGFEDAGWDGVDFHNLPAGQDWSRLEHCLLRGAVADTSGSTVPGALLGGTHRPQTGGAVSVVGRGRVAIAACEFRDNRAETGGAVYCGHGAAPVLAGNLFVGNEAGWRGSVLHNVYAYPKLVGNTLVANRCLPESAFERCSAVDNFNGKVLLSGNIIRGNITNHYSGSQLNECKPHDASDNNIEAFSGGVGNLDLPAAFLGSGAHPYRLTAQSPGLDKGPRCWWNPLLAATDPAGDPRVAFGGRDMGAYEYNGVVASAPDTPTVAGRLTLRCAPNPFNPRTEILLSLDAAQEVFAAVYDLRGRLVKRLAQGAQPQGELCLVWDGTDERGAAMPSGVYSCRVVTRNREGTLKMTLAR